MKKSLMALALMLLAGLCFGQNTLVVVPLQNRSGSGIASDVETITELLGNAVARTRRFDVVDRAALEDVMREHKFQMDDWSSDSKSVEMGRVLNANYIVRGQVSRLGSNLVVTGRILDVNTARILGTAEMQLYSIDDAYELMGPFVQELTANTGVTPSRQAGKSQVSQSNQDGAESAGASAASTGYQDFTTGQRWGTWALNFVPGLGSFVIMRDWVGGGIQAGASILGYIFLLGGIETTTTDYYGTSGQSTELTAGAYIGIGLLVGSGIVNIVRSAAYHKPRPKTAAFADPAAWNLVIVPAEDGIEKVQLSYTLRF